MPFFNETVAAAAAGRKVHAALLCFMDFKDDPVRWWRGFGDLEAGGHTWQGLGQLVDIDGLGQAVGAVAPPTTFTLSGVDRRIAGFVRNASEKVKDRRVIVYIQFFATASTTDSELWAPLDQPNAVWTGRMDQIRYTTSGDQRTVTLTGESIWADRNRPPFGLLTDADQRARFSGDVGLGQVAGLVNKTIRYPNF